MTVVTTLITVIILIINKKCYIRNRIHSISSIINMEGFALKLQKVND